MMKVWDYILFALSAVSLLCATTAIAAEKFDCRHNKYVVEACQKFHGRLSLYANSNIILWPVGSKRTFGLDLQELKTSFPELYDKLLDEKHYTAFADFEMCRYGHDVPGKMMSACIADMQNAKYFTYEEAEKLHLFD